MRKNWLLNIALAALCSAVLIWLTFLFMNWYTRHGEAVEVPNLKGINAELAREKLDEAGLKCEVFDSVYSADFKRDAVTEQDPPALAQVKPGRIIYITVNSLAKPKVKMPKLVDQSLTLSKSVLKNSGLVLGEVTFKYDEIGNNLVIEQLYKGTPVYPGKMLEKGSVIDLVVATNRRTQSEPDTLGLGLGGDDERPAPEEDKQPAPSPNRHKKKSRSK